MKYYCVFIWIFYSNFWNKISNKKNFYGKIRNRSKSGIELFHFVFIIPIVDQVTSSVIEYICIRDKISKEDFFDINIFENLSNLRNKQFFINNLNSNYKYNCALIDLNKFSDINNFFGSLNPSLYFPS